MDPNTDAAISISDLLKISVPLLTAMCLWLYTQIRSNMEQSTKNSQDIALQNQSMMTHIAKINAMEERVANLSDDLTQVKFSIQSLEHKQDKHHMELLSAIRQLGPPSGTEHKET